MVSVMLTISTPTALGRMCLKMIRALLAPEIRAASTNSRSRSDRNSAAHQAGESDPADQAEEDAARTPLLLASDQPPSRAAGDRADHAIERGMMMMTSVRRIRTASVQPRK